MDTWGRSALFCCFLLAGSLPMSVAVAERSVTFSGRVVDAGGKPAAGATVSVTLSETRAAWRDPNAAPLVRQTTAGGSGSFSLAVPVPGADWSAVVVAAKEGHGPGGERVQPTGPTTGLVLALTRPTTMAGTVVDRDGQPVAGATVKAQYAYYPDQEMAFLPPNNAAPSAATDAQGRFRLRALPAHCRVSLAAEHPGYARGTGAGEHVTSGTQDVLLRLPPPGAVVGRVVDAAGRPAAGVTVRCVWGPTPDATTDSDGRFRFSRLAGGLYTVSVLLPDGAATVAHPESVPLVEGGEARCPDLRLVPGGLLAGRVTMERGQGVPGVWVSASQQVLVASANTLTDVSVPAAWSGPDGSYRLRLPPGKWRISVQLLPRGYASPADWGREPEFAVGEGRTTHADFKLIHASRPARVLDASGRPAAGAKIHLTVRRGDRSVGDQQTADAAGRFTLNRALPDETAQLRAFSRDRTQGALVEMMPGRVKGEYVLRLQRLAVVQGVVREAGGRPVADAWVTADRMVPTGGGMSGHRPEQVSMTAVDAQGRFALFVFPSAQYRVAVEAVGYGTTDRYPVQVGNRRAVAPLKFTLARSDGFVAGVVVDPDGKPLAGATVSAGRTGATHVFVAGGESRTDTQGRFRIGHLPMGTVGVYAVLDGYEPDRRDDVEVGTPRVRLILAPREEATVRPSAPAVGARAPEIQAARWVNGDGVPSLSALRGKTVVLQFSSAYNRAARASNEALKTLHAALRARQRDEVVLLALYDASATAEEVAAYAREEGLPFSIGLVAPTRNLGADSPVFTAYGVRQLPAVFVIGGDGTVRAVNPAREELMRLAEP